MDEATKRAIDLLQRHAPTPETLAMVAQAESGAIKLGVLEFSGAGIETLRRSVRDLKARLAHTWDADDARSLSDAIGRTTGDIVYAEHMQSHPVIYVTQ